MSTNWGQTKRILNSSTSDRPIIIISQINNQQYHTSKVIVQYAPLHFLHKLIASSHFLSSNNSIERKYFYDICYYVIARQSKPIISNYAKVVSRRNVMLGDVKPNCFPGIFSRNGKVLLNVFGRFGSNCVYYPLQSEKYSPNSLWTDWSMLKSMVSDGETRCHQVQ
ncbi:hypothetical protein NQ317_002025 [Molorchus minor]|uniref:Uncharacterized protein n=1 Tax=Molorchus minor TaxID=1323400 RepID=A0ABQ9JPY8_9CUCU|nr:hypothetical protein NQ317_002025 [Molorchus minor]